MKGGTGRKGAKGEKIRGAKRGRERREGSERGGEGVRRRKYRMSVQGGRFRHSNRSKREGGTELLGGRGGDKEEVKWRSTETEGGEWGQFESSESGRRKGREGLAETYHISRGREKIWRGGMVKLGEGRAGFGSVIRKLWQGME